MGKTVTMLPANYYHLMAEYHLWMDEKIYTLCAGIPDELRKKDLGAFFKSIHGTLNHILFGDLAWMQRFTGEQLTTQHIGGILYENFDELRDAHLATDQKILAWVDTLEKGWLEEAVDYKSKAYNCIWHLPRWILVTHLMNHQTHHRGQLTTLLTQQGYDPGITDIPCLPSLEPFSRPKD